MNPSYTIEDVDIKTLYRMMLEHLRAGFRLVQIGSHRKRRWHGADLFRCQGLPNGQLSGICGVG